MKAIINNIIDFYYIQAENLNVLLSITQRTLDESKKERKTNEQIQRVENFVKDLTMDLNNMLAKFYFLKDRKSRTQEQLTDRQVKAITEFTVFVKTLTKNVCSLLKRFQAGQSFEEKLDREIEEIKAYVKQRLKECDEALSGTSGTLKYRFCKYVSNKVTSIKKFLRGKSFGLKETEKAKLDSLPPHRLEDIPIDSIDSRDTQLESFIDVLNINTGGSSSKKSEQQIHLEV